ncbi:MAG TPA: hypothetical protein VG738_11025 [Chitinophagaceae bacterium]|nr:hypothetical protein [Chitinophagaceae bacterium]
MTFDAENPVIQLCAAGMQKEGEGKPLEAKQLFYEAWEKAASPFEQFTAAHYVARRQSTVEEKLTWDEKCLAIALTIEEESMKANYPSLYLNVAKGFEDTGNLEDARKNYTLALSYTTYLPDDGYGNMIKAGINKGLQRVK